ncbi:MAG: 4Fe-4S dicluster domain-containing protein [Nitrososphaerota archaeon]
MGKVFIVDVTKCSGCYACYVTCKDEHVDNEWLPYAKPMPDTGSHWLKIEEKERGQTPYVKVTYMPIMCQHCDNPPCTRVCPVNAIEKRKDGVVIIWPEKCNGCSGLEKPLCIDACPYGVIYFNKTLNIAQKCTMCAHLLDGKDTLWKFNVPRCVDACHTGALIFGDEGDPKIKDLIKKAEILKPEEGTKPRVYYIGLPKPFFAGQVVDPVADEVIIGAKVKAIDIATGEVKEVETDELGDFWLRDLTLNHRYLVKVSKDGYYERTIGVVMADKDKSLGEIKLYKITK